MSELLRYKKDQLYLLKDYETEGLSLLASRPWQLSYLIAKGDKIIDIFDRYIWWEDLNISEGAKIITKFDYNYYKSKAEEPGKVLEELDKFIYNNKYIILWQNGLGYDCYIHNVFRKLMGKKTDYSYLNRSYDTNLLGKYLKYTNPPQIEENKLLWQYKLQSTWQKIKTSLKVLGEDYEIPFDPDKLHNSLEDIKLNFAVWNKQKWLVEI